jgi:hypothetical protein
MGCLVKAVAAIQTGPVSFQENRPGLGSKEDTVGV